MKDYARAIELTPDSLRYPEFSKAYETAHLVDEIWERLLAVSVKASEYISLGMLQFYAGRTDDAMKDWDRAVSLAPNEGRLVLARAILNDTVGRRSEAAADFRRAAQLGAKDELSFRGNQYTTAGVRGRELS